MIALTLCQVADAIGGRLLTRGHSVDSESSGAVQTDSREVGPGSIFVALRGATADGHDFVHAAKAGGASLAVVERELDLDIPQVLVPDTLEALAALARHVVSQVRECGELKVVAVTGSNGKTTTKNMLHAILSSRGETVAPRGSFNNEVGAPMTMLGVDWSTRFLVVEMGADAVGDIRKLHSVVVPDVAIVLTVGMAHIGKFGSAEMTELAKSEMVSDLPSDAVAVLNADDGRVRRMAGRTRAHVVLFGLDAGADIRGSDVDTGVDGTTFTVHSDGQATDVRLQILGEHHVTNALAALTAARALGIGIPEAAAALGTLTRAERWRMELTERPDGVTIINDAYNASPDSMSAALKTLAQLAGPDRRSFAVLGEMAELGEYANDEHDRIGRLVVRLNIGQLVVVGHNARHIHNAAGLEGSWDGESILAPDPEAAWEVIAPMLRNGDVVLVKASNAAGLGALGDRLAGRSS